MEKFKWQDSNSVNTCYAIRKIFKRIDKLNCFEDENKKIKNLRICMINSDFKINKNIKQKNYVKYLIVIFQKSMI